MPSMRRALIWDFGAWYEKGFSKKFMSSMRRAFSMSVWYLFRSVEMVKDIYILWDVVFVICMIYGSMRGMEVKDTENMRL